MYVNPLQSLALKCILAPKLVAETFQNRQARVAIKESRADHDACAHGARARPWLILRCARERLVRVRVHGSDFASLTFNASLHLYASFLASFDPCLAYFSLRLQANTSRHLVELRRNQNSSIKGLKSMFLHLSIN